MAPAMARRLKALSGPQALGLPAHPGAVQPSGTSLWLDEPYAPRPAPRGEVACDVAIVGGGVAGASVAWALAGHGLRVLLLEAQALAARASGRNAGFVITNLAESYDQVAREKGRDAARAIWQVNEANREAVAGLVAELKIECGFARTGSYCAAASSDEAVALEASARMLREDGFAARWLPPEDAMHRIGAAGKRGALLREGDGQIQPARFTRGLAAAAEARGVRLHEGAPVRALAREREGWRLQGEGFAVRADRVVLCTNAYSNALHPWFAGWIQPVRGQVLATAPLPGFALAGPVYADHGYDYWRLHEARLVVGGRRPVARGEEVGVRDELNPRVQNALDALLRELAPGVAPRVTHRWAGIMDFSADGLPLVGPVPGEGGLLTAVGFTGHGMGYATVAGQWLAEHVLHGKDPTPALLRSDRARPAGPIPY
jgi:glycine/D-amino acid oxidase-like deaminating enzyme